ncbi:hypothetical protein PY092_13410 [Muricauda sp. 334s03]|uniref:Uncharacterized protein n=1 Tax=Flagellimonas yonaguniensis TaxID=3031325 RepID=A0ABT5Y132_9FLAO|nr:hypothetical protein [[Muricauda] yonaguniensis]MDF0717155.1 hypothetical protein [[Muricauda] yonaguniensis]
MKYYILIPLFLCTAVFSFAQKNGSNLRSGQMQSYNPILSSSVNDFVGSDNPIEGSRFVFEDFDKSGTIYTANQLYRTEGLNIDALKHDIILKVGQDSILVLDKNNIDSLKINGRLFKKIEKDDRLFEVLYQNPGIALLGRYDCQIKKGNMNVMKGTTEKDSYKITESHFLFIEGKGIEAFSMRKKDVLNHFDDKRFEIKAYVQENNLDFKHLKDVVKIFDFYYTTKD